MKRLLFLLLCFVWLSATTAQKSTYLLRHKNRGAVTWASSASRVDSITFSTLDLDSVDRGEVVTEEVWQNNGHVSRFLLSTADSLAVGKEQKGAIELGLNVKWAACNLGATSPEEFGGLFAWADTVERSIYTSHGVFYNDSLGYNVVPPGLTNICGTQYDVARAKLGQKWRMHSMSEHIELFHVCSHRYGSYNGVVGIFVTGSNGNSIFLPEGGYQDGDTHNPPGGMTYYWTGTYKCGYYCFRIRLESPNTYLLQDSQYGFSVRPVDSGSAQTGNAAVGLDSVICYGDITIGNDEPVSYGICYSSTQTTPKGENAIFIPSDSVKDGHFEVIIRNLEPDSVYYYRAYLQRPSGIYYGEVKKFTSWAHITPGAVVDLGLSVKWGSCNVGAASPQDYGGYYAWGETETKDNYALNTYKYYNKDAKTYINIGNDITGTQYDAAYVKKGGLWRLPTIAELTALVDSCSFKRVLYYGVSGLKVTASNGNSIFLPAVGYIRNTGKEMEYDACYSCSSVFSTHSVQFLNCYCEPWKNIDIDYRYVGYNLRPVYDDNIAAFTGEVTNLSAHSATCKAIFKTGEEKPLSCGICFSSTQKLPDKDNAALVPGDSINVKTFLSNLSNLDNDTVYYYRAYLQLPSGFYYGKVKKFMTHADVTPGKAVDLGLSAIWAGWNVGAETPDGYGDYFAWGETEKKQNYTWNNYTFFNDSSKTSRDIGYYIGGTEYDAARAKWGNEWRLPTLDEMRELRERCACRWVIYNGVKGIKATGPNGNSIFLPAAGNYWGEELNYDEEKGCYWTESYVLRSNRIYGYYNFFQESVKGCQEIGGSMGQSIRPVLNNGKAYTLKVDSIGYDRATCYGTVKAGYENIISCGICYSPTHKWPKKGYDEYCESALNADGSVVCTLNNLTSGTIYYYCTYLQTATRTLYGNVKRLRTSIKDVTPGMAVDLGLSVLWAGWNMGATQPQDYGGLYAWGETEVKDSYSWKNYLYCNGDESSCRDLGDLIGGTDYDVAHIKWGGKWRMPTIEEWNELAISCKRKACSYRGTDGVLFTASNGNCIFFPLKTIINFADVVEDVTKWDCYWADYKLRVGISRAAWLWDLFDQAEYEQTWGNWYMGLFVRPVADK